MKRKRLKSLMTFLSIAVIVTFIISNYGCKKQPTLSQEKYDNIQAGFTIPQDTNRVWTYYYWIDDDISKEGVTKDLEAMKEFGIGAVLIGNINPDEIDGPVPLFSDEWWETMVHVVKEGDRIGIDIGFFNCPGWSQSGGPWVSYDKAMRHLVYTELKARGGKLIDAKLEKPAEEFQDTYVLAFNTIEEESNTLSLSNSSIKAIPSISGVNRLIDGDRSSSSLFAIREGAEYKLTISSEKPVKARSIEIFPAKPVFKCNVDLYVNQDGEEKLLKSFLFDRSNVGVNVGPVTHGSVAISIPETNANTFSLVCTDLSSTEPNAGFAEIIISEAPVLERYIEKSLGKMHPTPFPEFDTYMWEMQNSIDDKDLIVSDVLDISDEMDENGNLSWDAPEGNWTILRIGMTPTGTKNSPAAPQGKGYEIDKASAELVKFHFEQYIGEILERIPEENRDAFKYVIADSYEMGSQNWTDDFAAKFKAKFGYDPVKYLPVFSGRIVGSVEESERFLWDLRRAVADDVAYEYVGGLREISNEHNLQIWLENYGHWGYPGEFLMYGGQSNLVSGEFWNEGHLGDIECKSASSAAHMYGKPITSAEAFTAAYQSYKRYPAVLKKRGDWSFTEGINHFVLHLYIQQPDDERIPGINAWFSTEFNRHNTWFDQGKHWVDYLRRNQHLLQQGKYAADVLYYIGEDAPKMTGTRNPELPQGYSYDYINAEVIIERLSVEDGKFVLPDGMTYSLLVLPDNETMRPEVLSKIETLISDGGAVLGRKPVRSPSLQNYPECDEEVKNIAAKIWPDEYEDGKLISNLGSGYIMDGIGIQEALDKIGVPKDLQVSETAPVLWTHRTMPGMEIYFISNQSEETISIEPSFRVEGLKPQLWNAVTGEIRTLNNYSVENGRTVVPIKLSGLQSWYVVFTNQSNEQVEQGYADNFPEPKTLLTIDSPWSVEFENDKFGPEEELKWDKLMDWTQSDNDKIKYYSGTAEYTTTFNVESLPENGKFYLNLGDVGVMAEVKLNGKDLGGVWIEPFRLNTNDALRKGENILELEVVNVWRNRMVGDLNLPERERYTWTTVSDVEKGEELMPSGLMGPVTVEVIEQ